MPMNFSPYRPLEPWQLTSRGIQPTSKDWGPVDVSKQLQEGIGGLYAKYRQAYGERYQSDIGEEALKRQMTPGGAAASLAAPGGPYDPNSTGSVQPTAGATTPQGAKLPSFAGNTRPMSMPPSGAHWTPENRAALVEEAKNAGLDPEQLATVMSYETGGTMNPWQKGPTTKWGQHRGLIQFGEPQRQQYGVTEDMPFRDQVRASIKYLQDKGLKPGMGMLEMYSAINAGGIGEDYYNRSDAKAGGAPGTVRDKVQNQMGGHAARVKAWLSGYNGQPNAPAAGGGGGGSIYDADTIANARTILTQPDSTPEMKQWAGNVLATATERPVPPQGPIPPPQAGGPAMQMPGQAPPPQAPNPTPATNSSQPLFAPPGGAPAVGNQPVQQDPNAPGQPAMAGTGTVATNPNIQPQPQQGGPLPLMAQNPQPGGAPLSSPQMQMPPGSEAPPPPPPPPEVPPPPPPPPPQAIPQPQPQGPDTTGGLGRGGYAPTAATGQLTDRHRQMLALAAASGNQSLLDSAKTIVAAETGIGGKGTYGFTEVNGQLYRTNPQTGEAVPVAGGAGSARSTELVKPTDAARRAELNIDPNDRRTYQVKYDAKTGKVSETQPLSEERRDPNPIFTQQEALTKEITSNPEYKAYNAGVQMLPALKASFTQGNTQGDLAGVFQFMKALDPTSTVSAGEQASAKDTGGIYGGLWAMYNKAIGEGGLTADQRQQFYNTAVATTQGKAGAARQAVETGRRKAAGYPELKPDMVHLPLPETPFETVKTQVDPKTGKRMRPFPNRDLEGNETDDLLAPGKGKGPVKATVEIKEGEPGSSEKNPRPAKVLPGGTVDTTWLSTMPSGTYVRMPSGVVIPIK